MSRRPLSSNDPVPDRVLGKLRDAGLVLGSVGFSKPSETPTAILAKLGDRGLSIADKDRALRYLTHVGGFRLKGYYHHLTDPATKMFLPGTTFEDVVLRYEFDGRLRLLTFKAIGTIEVSLRAIMTNQLSMRYGSHWFFEHDKFTADDRWNLGEAIIKIEDAVVDSFRQPYIQHYYTSVNSPPLPPSWAVSECITFGTWSRSYNYIKDQTVRKAISMRFDIDDPAVFASWLHAVSFLRNVVAHHDRLLNKHMSVSPKAYLKRKIDFATKPKSMFACATVMNCLLTAARLPQTWKADLENLFRDYPSVDPAEIGFPPHWQTLPGWI